MSKSKLLNPGLLTTEEFMVAVVSPQIHKSSKKKKKKKREREREKQQQNTEIF